MYNKKGIFLSLFFSSIMLLSTMSLIGAEEEFDYDIVYSLSTDAVEAGAEITATIALTGRYIADSPYDLDKQIEADVELLLDGSVIGEATIPAGPMEIVPYQDITISETIPALIPSNILPGFHELAVKCSFNALGYDVNESKTFQIEVVEVQSSPVVQPPRFFFSLSPTQMYLGSTSTLTVRVFNPNESSMSLGVSLFSEMYGHESLLETYELTLEGGENEEIRRTFRLMDGDVKELCFLARLNWYEVDGERHTDALENGQSATILKRPQLRPLVLFDDLSKLSEEEFQASLQLVFTNETTWERSLIVEHLEYSLALPEQIGIIEMPLDILDNVRRDTILTVKIKGPLDELYDPRCVLDGEYVFGDPDEDVSFLYPFALPSTNEIREALGMEPLVSGKSNDPNPGNSLGITTFLLGNQGNNDRKDDMNEIFSYLDQLFQ